MFYFPLIKLETAVSPPDFANINFYFVKVSDIISIRLIIFFLLFEFQKNCVKL